MGLIFLASSQPTLPSIPSGWDLIVKKAMHVTAYAVLTWLYVRALRGRRADDATVRRADQVKTLAVSAGLALAYALSDEYHQTFVPGRNGSLVDVGVDALGVSVFILYDWLQPTQLRSRRERASE
jgi:VanZ family protein